MDTFSTNIDSKSFGNLWRLSSRLQLCSLLEADMTHALSPSSSQNSGSQKRKCEWWVHKGLVTYDVFKRVYLSRLPSTKGPCASFPPLPLYALTLLYSTIIGLQRISRYSHQWSYVSLASQLSFSQGPSRDRGNP